MRLSLSRRLAITVCGMAVVLVLVVLGRDMLMRILEQHGNPVATPPPYQVDAIALAVHRRLFVADLHADTLLSGRDVRKANDYGQLDLPSLRAGRVGLQVFSIVTNMPFCRDFVGCHRYPNLVAAVAVMQGWPLETWMSDKVRALHQAAKLQAIAADPAAGLVLLRERSDLIQLLSTPSGVPQIGAVLSVEGAQAIGNDVAGVDELAGAGVRILGLAHYFDNSVSGSAHGVTRGGLSAFGKLVVQRALERGMIIDLAHAAPQAISDFLDAWPGAPFVVSHTGLRSVCNSARNLDDAQVHRIVAAGGIVGIGGWNQALCPPSNASAGDYVKKIIETIIHAVAMADLEHPGHGHEFVALGSDFDGWVPVGFDASGWPLITEGLLRAGSRLGQAEIERIIGGNVCRLLFRSLPDNGALPQAELCNARRSGAERS
jgi:membrane dipeptidase